MRYFALQLRDKYCIKCYKKNDKDKLYSFILKVDKSYIYTDLDVDRFLSQTYRFTTQELRIIKRYLRMCCELVDLSTTI